MWEYLAILLIGFWLGVALLLYYACYWMEEILDLPSNPSRHRASPSRNGRHSSHSSHSELSGGGASGAHAQLKRLVARVVEEAAALPALAEYAGDADSHHSPSPPIHSSTYEDLLASAILNKVIERYQTENGSGGRSSGIHSASASPSPSETSSPPSPLSRERDITPTRHLPEEDISDWEDGDTGDEILETPRRVPFPEFGGDIVHYNDSKNRDFDEVSGSDIQAVDGSWEGNWLFQKKKIKTTQSVPVPMLVPNSNTDYRALIGDRDADDTTDLSDNASDAEEDTQYKSDVKRILESKHVIGGGTKLDETMDFEPDSLTIDDCENYFENEDDQIDHNNVIDAVNNTIFDKNEINHEQINGHKNETTEADSILILDIDSGPLAQTEFNLKEEIHRTILKGEAEKNNLEDLNTKTNGEIYKDIMNELPNVNVSNNNTMSRHEREGEYEETVALPEQRYADSLRRKHFDDDIKERPSLTSDITEDLIPGSIAYRERTKWLNYVEMPNNPYSPEAIQKRLSAKNTSSLFDTITSKKNDVDEVDNKISIKDIDETKSINEKISHEGELLKNTTDKIVTNGIRPISPSPKILKNVLAEEVPQYKRYGRDYYIKEAKKSSGSRKRNTFSDTSSISSVNKSTSLDNDTEFASPVSSSSSFSDLEAVALHQNIVRAVLSPRNASPNFAINPIFKNPDRQNSDENRSIDDNSVNQYTNVRKQSRNVCNDIEGEGNVENEDIVRLKIPNKPEITEDLFETYHKVRRSNTLRSDDLNVRSKRRPALNFTFGGSLRLSKGFHTNLW